jgi:phage FluMu protein Com
MRYLLDTNSGSCPTNSTEDDLESGMFPFRSSESVPMSGRFVQYVHKHPPRCISSVNAKPTERSEPSLRLPRHQSIYHGYHSKDADTASFVVGCPCGCWVTYLLGYYVTSEGSRRADTGFVGPLCLECPQCRTVSEFFDTRKHGHDGEQGVNTHIIGTGRPNRFACPRCGEVPVIVLANFSYQGVEHFRGEMRERKQDFFNTFDVVVWCPECKVLVEVTSFECD